MTRFHPSCPGVLRVGLSLILLSLPGLQGCTDNGATGPDTSVLEIVVLGGSGQSASPGSPLPEPFRVRVQTLANGSVKDGVKVRWQILEGSGASLDHTLSVTDESGVAEARLTLGSRIGSYQVRASVSGMTAPPADFHARAILDPRLTLVPGGPVLAGDTILLEGLNFSPVPLENVVTFSGIRGRVLEASATLLEVQVPACLPSREVALVLRIGSLETDAEALTVQGGTGFLNLSVGEDRLLDAGEGLACFRLPSVPGSSYLLVPHSTGTVGGAEYAVELVGLAQDAVEPTSGAQPAPPWVRASGGPGRNLTGNVPDAHWEWESHLRVMEREWLRDAIARMPGRQAAPAQDRRLAEPELGDVREFKVLNRDNDFDGVTARIHYMTEHCLIYVDDETPSGGFAPEDLAFFARQFEDPIYPTVTRIFGSESDLDGNGRVIILFTPGVNRLTDEDSDGYVGGFFFGVDLQDGLSGSNKGEIFYAVVPDPTGIHGPVLNRMALMSSLPAIIAHEFEHMVHFNRRILQAGAPSQDALWLSEALAQMAEDLVGEAFHDAGDPVTAMDYQVGNWSRARRFLLNPSQVSVLTTLPPGTLAERGAGWLLLKHLFGREGGESFIRTLTSSTDTGVENVTNAVGREWSEIVSDWAGSLYLDGLSVPVRSGLRVLGVNLRDVLSRLGGTYPLSPPTVGGSSFSVPGTLWSSAPDYYILTTPERGGLAVNLSGPGGGAPDPASGLDMLLVRLR